MTIHCNLPHTLIASVYIFGQVKNLASIFLVDWHFFISINDTFVGHVRSAFQTEQSKSPDMRKKMQLATRFAAGSPEALK